MKFDRLSIPGVASMQPEWPEHLAARLWVSPRLLREHDDDPRLWLALSDGRVLALRLPQVPIGDDAILSPLVEALWPDVQGKIWEIQTLGRFGFVQLLYAAPVVPPLAPHGAWVLHEDFQRFLGLLDREILALLMWLEREPTPAAAAWYAQQAPHPLPPPFFASVRNYNRLAVLPSPLRQYRLQALARFPALVTPLLLTVHRTTNTFGGKRHAWREKDETVETAIDQGRDLTGTLATHYGISRALVRSAVNGEYWHVTRHAERRSLLAMLDALPDNQRPDLPAFERWYRYLSLYFELVGEHSDRAVHRGAFRLGWTNTWEGAAKRFGNLQPAFADCRDFLAEVRTYLAQRQQRRAPHATRIAQGFCACYGLLGLLTASQRWHRLRPRLYRGNVTLATVLPAILGEIDIDGNHARELLTPAALAEEGDVMMHCVAGYWRHCVAGDRIFALRLANGERATAHYRPGAMSRQAPEVSYRLEQLRGPLNAEVSQTMQAFAEAVAERINDPAHRDRRLAALSFGARPEVEVLRVDMPVWLDAKTERQLQAVLAWLRTDTMQSDVLFDDFIAGYAYHDGPQVEEELRIGDALDLVREPNNPHDPLAVRIDWRGHPLGYIPRRANAEIAHALDGGARLRARIDTIDLQADLWERVAVVVIGA